MNKADGLIELRKELFKDKVIEDGYEVLSKEAKKKLAEIDLEIHRLRERGDILKEIDKVVEKLDSSFEAAIENIKDEIDEKISKRLDGLEQYLNGIVGLLEVLIKR